MITVTRLNGRELTLNALLIESIEATPDTIITLTTGNKFIVREKVDEVIKLIKDFLQQTGSIRVVVQNVKTEGS